MPVIQLRSQQELRAARCIGFCCICGNQFADREKRTRQHVPPKAIFAVADRTPPLILPAHEKCNNEQSSLDTVIGQLVAVLHQKHPSPEDVKLDVGMFHVKSGEPTAGVQGLPLTRIIFRWARCFHAALYREYLPDRGGTIFPPFPEGDLIDGRLVYRKIPASRPLFTDVFKQQVKAGRTDAVICYNGKCHYRCTWLNLDPPNDHRTFCLFALRLYNWEVLSDPQLPRRGCIGTYEAPIPPDAARGTQLVIPAPNSSPLDPFAD